MDKQPTLYGFKPKAEDITMMKEVQKEMQKLNPYGTVSVSEVMRQALKTLYFEITVSEEDIEH